MPRGITEDNIDSYTTPLPISYYSNFLIKSNEECKYLSILEELKLMVEILKISKTKSIDINNFLPSLYIGNDKVLRLARINIEIEGAYHIDDGLNEEEAFKIKKVDDKNFIRNMYYEIVNKEKIKDNYRNIFIDDVLNDYSYNLHQILKVIGTYKNNYSFEVLKMKNLMIEIFNGMEDFYASHFGWIPKIYYDYNSGSFFNGYRKNIRFHSLEIKEGRNKITNNIFILLQYKYFRFIIPYVLDYLKKIFMDAEYFNELRFKNPIKEMMMIIYQINSLNNPLKYLAISKILIENFNIIMANYGLIELNIERKSKSKPSFIDTINKIINVKFIDNPITILHFIKYSYRKCWYNWEYQEGKMIIYRNPEYYTKDQGTWALKERQLLNYNYQSLPDDFDDPKYLQIHFNL